MSNALRKSKPSRKRSLATSSIAAFLREAPIESSSNSSGSNKQAKTRSKPALSSTKPVQVIRVSSDAVGVAAAATSSAPPGSAHSSSALQEQDAMSSVITTRNANNNATFDRIVASEPVATAFVATALPQPVAPISVVPPVSAIAPPANLPRTIPAVQQSVVMQPFNSSAAGVPVSRLSAAPPVASAGNNSINNILAPNSPLAFQMLTHLHRPRTVFFVRVQGNEEFLSGSRTDPNGGLLQALVDVHSVVRGQRFLSLDNAKMLMQHFALQLMGFTCRLIDAIITTRWSDSLWNECDRSLVCLFERLSSAQIDLAASRFQSSMGPASLSSSPSTLNAALLAAAPPDALIAMQRIQQRNQNAMFAQYSFQFQHFCSWIAGILDDFRCELVPHFPLLVFQQCYVDLLMHSSSENAVMFFERFVGLFDTSCALFARGGNSGSTAASETLRSMRHIRTKEQMARSDLGRYLRLRRDAPSGQYIMQPILRTFYVSPECYRFLQHNLVVVLMPKIAVVVRTYVHFAVNAQHADSYSRIIHVRHEQPQHQKQTPLAKESVVIDNFDNLANVLSKVRSLSSSGRPVSDAEFASRALQLEHTMASAAHSRAKMQALEAKKTS